MRDLRRHFENVRAECKPSAEAAHIIERITAILGDIAAVMKASGFHAEFDDQHSIIGYQGRKVSLETRMTITDTTGKFFHGGTDPAYTEFTVYGEKMEKKNGFAIFGGGETHEFLQIKIPYFEPEEGGWVHLDLTAPGAIEKAAEILVSRYARRVAAREIKKEIRDTIESASSARGKPQKPGW